MWPVDKVVWPVDKNSTRPVVKTYEPNGKFNHYCTRCMGKNECTCQRFISRICACGKLWCNCKIQQSSLDLILSSIATAINCIIQDNVQVNHQWRYLIIKDAIGIPTNINIENAVLIVNNIIFELSDPSMFDKLNNLLNYDYEMLLNEFFNANIYGESIIQFFTHNIKHSCRFMLIYPYDNKVGDTIIQGKCIMYNYALGEIHTHTVAYP